MSQDPKINPKVYEMPKGIPVRVEKQAPSVSQQRAIAAAMKACDDAVTGQEMTDAIRAYLSERRDAMVREFGQVAGYLIDDELRTLR